MEGQSDITYRDACEADWGALCAVHDRARPLELAGSCDARAFVPLAQDPEGAQLARCRVRVACDASGAVVGFAGVDGAYVAWLYVDPAHHGRGLGRALLHQVLALAGPAAWTICLRDNAPARALYASEGFVVTREWDGRNAGYPCTVVRLQLPPVAAVTGVPGDFWEAADRLLAACQVVVDRPRGSRHPRYADTVYPLDYGYLAGTTAPDGAEVDVWLGSLQPRRLDAVVCAVDPRKQDVEVKLLLGCTAAEQAAVLAFHTGAMLVARPPG